jgi:hypothetical protein
LKGALLNKVYTLYASLGFGKTLVRPKMARN